MKASRPYGSPKRRMRPVALCAAAVIFIAACMGTGWYLREQQQAANAEQARQVKVAAEVAAREAKKNEPVYITLPGAEPIRAIVEDYTRPDSLWAMVNKTSPLPSLSYLPSRIVVLEVPTRTDKSIEERSVRQELVEPLKDMFAAAGASGHSLMIGSAYRSADLQALYFNNYVQTSGHELANQYSAQPGQSEHQLGLAVDISTLSQQCYLSECFTSTPDGEWLANNAHKYGFIMRYPKGKEGITGYNFEPWHYRYVGADLATALYRSGLTLEEAWPYLEKALATLKENGAI
jgi:D-alanyl-D-alanine carboxypeptidase